jgi:HAD superfamily hydrolase (TIGR01450 family)
MLRAAVARGPVLRGPHHGTSVCDDPPMTGYRMTDAGADATDLRERLAGVRGLVLDLDGVLVLKAKLLPGAAEALAELDERGMPWVVGTNMSLASRATLARELARGGLPVPAERMVTAASAAAAVARRRFGTAPLYVMGSEDAMAEFAGLTLLSHDQAAEPGVAAAAVIVGDAGDEFTTRNIQSAFRLLRGGAAFVAMHKNRWWITPDGVLLDSGSYVAALEYATERRALVTGKPSRAFFGEAVRMLGAGAAPGNGAAAATAAAGAADVAERGAAERGAAERGAAERGAAERGAAERLSSHEVAIVGDDLWNDIRGAQKAGLRGVFVLSGKHGKAELARAAAERGGREPDAIAPSIVEVVAALA